jgi:hypothetical protein
VTNTRAIAHSFFDIAATAHHFHSNHLFFKAVEGGIADSPLRRMARTVSDLLCASAEC